MRDAKILDLFFDRDQEAILAVREQYGGKMRKMALNILGSMRDAEECVNDALLAAWNAIPPARPDPLLPWLYATVRNIAVDRLRYNKAQKRWNSSMVTAMEELEEIADSPDSTAEAADRKELVRALERFLSRQTRLDRELLMGRYFAGLSYSEMAARLDMSEGNCKVRVTRLRKKLKQYLKKEGVL